MNREGFQGPTQGQPAEGFAERYSIACHPAFRLGFLDAQHNRAFSHDRILDRIEAETPANALKRVGWRRLAFSIADKTQTELAQYRYEEGRLLVKAFNLRCKAWGHPDYPPAQVVEFCRTYNPNTGAT